MVNTKLTSTLLTFLLTIQFTLAQIIIKDSIVTENALRIGLGAQHSFYSEIGFSRHKSNKKPGCGFGHESPSGYYSALEWTAKTQNYKDVFGIKVGYEITLIGILISGLILAICSLLFISAIEMINLAAR